MPVKAGVSKDGVNVPSATGSILTPDTTSNRETITSAVFHNSSGGAVTLMVWIVPDGGSPDSTNKVIERSIATNESYTAPEIAGQTIESGGSLQANDADGTALSFVATVTQFSGDS